MKKYIENELKTKIHENYVNFRIYYKKGKFQFFLWSYTLKKNWFDIPIA
jgi:hypothetical protein